MPNHTYYAKPNQETTQEHNTIRKFIKAATKHNQKHQGRTLIFTRMQLLRKSIKSKQSSSSSVRNFHEF